MQLKAPSRTVFLFFLFFASLSYAKEHLLIQNVTIISAERLPKRDILDVLISDGEIAAIGKNLGIKVKFTKVIDGTRKFLSPGLFDTHVHLKVVPGMPMGQDSKYPEIAAAYFKQMPKSYLYFGFTNLIDLAVLDFEFIKKFREETIRPDLWDCGASLPISEGYPMMFMPTEIRYASFPNFLYDERYASKIPTQYKEKNHTPKAAVARVKKSGGICIKTYIESGWGNNQWPLISESMMKNVLHEAKKKNLVVLAHANSLKSHQRAVSDGVDILAHGVWNWGKYHAAPTLPEEIKNNLDQMIAKNISYIPTLRMMGGIRSMFEPDFLKDPNLKHVIPASLLSWYQTKEGQAFRQELIDEDPKKKDLAYALQTTGESLENGKKALQYLASKKAKILFGTDTPGSPSWGNPPGYNGYLELQTMHDAGMDSQAIFQSATLESAQAFGLMKEVGTIEIGKRANLLLLKEDPSLNPKAFNTIEQVFVRGQMVNRKDLSAQ